MFLSLLAVTYFADTLEDLALETDALKTTAANYNCRFTELYFQQERAFNTAMPYGLRRIESVRTMLTKSLTALAVSYTHLDVYKRQLQHPRRC